MPYLQPSLDVFLKEKFPSLALKEALLDYLATAQPIVEPNNPDTETPGFGEITDFPIFAYKQKISEFIELL